MTPVTFDTSVIIAYKVQSVRSTIFGQRLYWLNSRPALQTTPSAKPMKQRDRQQYKEKG